MKGNTVYRKSDTTIKWAWRILEKRPTNTRKPVEWPGRDLRMGTVSQYSRRPDTASMVTATCAF